MRDRLTLHELLCETLGSRNVYFQPPASVHMQYPAIVYRLSNIRNQHANDDVYASSKQYEITVIDHDPDSGLPDKVNQLQSARFARAYASDNLNHWIFEIFY